jgi:hypothetical protein
MSSKNSITHGRISLLLPYHLDEAWCLIFSDFQVLWADNRIDLERIIQRSPIDLALEWQHGPEDYPIRDLLRRHQKDASVFLCLNWNSRIPRNFQELGYTGYLYVPFNIDEMRRKFYDALPVNKRGLLYRPGWLRSGNTE